MNYPARKHFEKTDSTSVSVELEPQIIDIVFLLTGHFGCVHRNQDRFD